MTTVSPSIQLLELIPRSKQAATRSGPDFHQLTDEVAVVVLPLVREAIMLTNAAVPSVLRPLFRVVVVVRLIGWVGKEPEQVRIALQTPDAAMQDFSAFWMVREGGRFVRDRDDSLEAMSRNPRYLDDRNWGRACKKVKRHINTVLQEHYTTVKSGAVTPILELAMEFREGGLFQTDFRRSVREGDWVGEHSVD